MTSVLIRRGRDTKDALMENGPCEDTVRREPSASQKERPSKKSNLLTP